MNFSRGRILKNVVSSILVVLIFLLSFISLVNFSIHLIYIETRVKGFSMQPTLNSNVLHDKASGDKIFINPYCEFTNNDIVVAKVDWHDHYIIKRVIGMPGDKIEIKMETEYYGVYVNDNLLYTRDIYFYDAIKNSLEYKPDHYEYYTNYLKFLENNGKPNNNPTYIQLEEDEYFLMGDNWGHTTDSIEKGPIKKSNVVGKVDIIIDVEDENLLLPTWHFLKKIFS